MAISDKLKGAFANQGAKNPSCKIALRVQKFEVDEDNPGNSLVTGERLDNGETIQAYLRPDERKNPNPQYPRPEIADLVKSGKSEVKPGGVIQLDGAYLDTQRNQYSARWAKTLLHHADKGSVFVGQTRVSPMRRSENGVDYKTVECLSSKVNPVTSEKDLRAVMTKNFDGGTGTPFNMIRIVGEDGEAVSRIFYGRQKKSEQDGKLKYEPLSGQEMMDYLDKNPRFNNIMSQMKDANAFTAKDITVEVVAGRQVRVGSDSCNDAFGRAFIAKSRQGLEYSRFAHGIVTLIWVGENKQGLVATSASTVHYQADFNPHGLGGVEAVKRAPQKPAASENTAPAEEEVEMRKPAQTAPAGQEAKVAAAPESGSGLRL